jgi:hypothetical protein
MSDDIEAQLRRWGLVKVCVKEVVEEAKENPRAHIIERTRRFAPLTIKKAAKKLVRRDGTDRRRILAQAAGVRGMPVTPLWASDPINCAQTRKGQWARPKDDPGPSITMPLELTWVDRALEALSKKSLVLGLVVRVEYTCGGTQQQRAMTARAQYGGELTYWQYRKQLARALALLEGFQMAA